MKRFFKANLIVNDEAVAFIGPGDEVVRVRVIDHLPQLAQEGRHVGGQLRQDDLHDRKHLAVVFGFARDFAIQHQLSPGSKRSLFLPGFDVTTAGCDFEFGGRLPGKKSWTDFFTRTVKNEY